MAKKTVFSAVFLCKHARWTPVCCMLKVQLKNESLDMPCTWCFYMKITWTLHNLVCNWSYIVFSFTCILNCDWSFYLHRTKAYSNVFSSGNANLVYFEVFHENIHWLLVLDCCSSLAHVYLHYLFILSMAESAELTKRKFSR